LLESVLTGCPVRLGDVLSGEACEAQEAAETAG